MINTPNIVNFYKKKLLNQFERNPTTGTFFGFD